MMVEEGADKVTFVRPIEPFRIGVYVFALLWGSLTLINYGPSANSVVKAYPGIGGWVFLALLALGGVTSLASYLVKTITGLRLELAGLTLLVLLCVAYAVWTPFSVGWLRGLGLQLTMLILIAAPGYFASRSMARYIESLERLQQDQTGGREAGPDASDNIRMDSRTDWRRWWDKIHSRRSKGPLP